MQSISKIRKDVKDLKDVAGVGSEPSLNNFIKYCERAYGRPIRLFEELWFIEYDVDGKKVKPNPSLLCRLSDEYFEEMHGVENPFKSTNNKYRGLISFKYRVCDDYIEKHNIHYSEKDNVLVSDEFNEYFKDWWDKLKTLDDFWADYSWSDWLDEELKNIGDCYS